MTNKSILRRNLLLGAVLLLLILAYVLLGSFHVSLGDFFAILGGKNIPGASFIIREERLPRLLIGLLAGAALGLGGTCFQLMLRNPLASPDVVGVSAASSLAVVTAMAFFGLNGLPLSITAFAGGLGATLLIILFAGRDGSSAASSRFVLSGVALAALFVALVHYMLSRMSLYKAASASIWLTGSLGQATWQRVVILAILFALACVALIFTARPLHQLSLGDDLATALGIHVGRLRWAVIIIGVFLTSAAVAATGPVAFVGFMAGPVVRLLMRGPDSLWGSALMGAILVVASDFLGREIGLPVGVITGIIGMPILLFFILKRGR
ncbi:MAG: iron ABC transporter permease [Corynebacterium sp.]|nr:iron ABC transporter permease [Corynebacterium sp.]